MDLAAFSPTTLAGCLSRDRVMDAGIRPLWADMPRLAGPAFPVELVAGDNLMLHAAIYEAPAGSVIVVDAGDSEYAVAGGNVCSVAQRRGVAGFVVDGVIRDLAEIRSSRFPVLARGVLPYPGAKRVVGELGRPVRCGGVLVAPGDVVVADEEGVVVVPHDRVAETCERASQRAAADAAQTLDQWEASHRARIAALLRGGAG